MEQIEEEITKLKQNGNKSFGQKDYSSAIKYYTQGLQHNIFTKHNNDNNNLNETLIKLLQSLLLNRAKAYFKSENLKNALIDTSTCIQTSNSTKMAFKAHFTRAEIYGTLNDAKNAIVHCDNILRVCIIYIFILAHQYHH